MFLWIRRQISAAARAVADTCIAIAVGFAVIFFLPGLIRGVVSTALIVTLFRAQT